MGLAEYAGAAAFLLFVLPASVYLCVRLARYAYLKSKYEFDRQHQREGD